MQFMKFGTVFEMFRFTIYMNFISVFPYMLDFIIIVIFLDFYLKCNNVSVAVSV